MNAILKSIIVVVIAMYLAFNVITSWTMTSAEMEEEFVSNQCSVGVVLTNTFFLPAWILKIIKLLIDFIVK